MRTLQFWNNKPAKCITMIQHHIIGIKNLGMTNGLVPSYLNKAYVDAFLRQAICDVFEEKTKLFKGNVVSSVGTSPGWCSREMVQDQSDTQHEHLGNQ